MKRIAVIAGAGPAGLTAALELLRRSNVVPIVFEADAQVGGISKTVNYRGNRMDLGGHRFFSKSDWVMRWWQDILPVAAADSATGDVASTLAATGSAASPLAASGEGASTDVARPLTASKSALRITYQRQSRALLPVPCASASSDQVMLVRNRLSRIFYRRRFFDYPLKLNADTLRNMGVAESLLIGLSYARARLKLRPAEDTLEEFFINRFGNRLYRTFFKDYTEKVWGVPCQELSAEWGAQRIKGLSIGKALAHALTKTLGGSGAADTAQRGTETSLIERFLYPKFGPGQMWEEVARRIALRGGAIHLHHRVVGIERRGWRVEAVDVLDTIAGSVRRVPCDHFVSTLPVRDLTALLNPDEPHIAKIAGSLPYRDFMTVGLLVRRMNTLGKQGRPTAQNGMPPDNWIYIQEPDVRIGRLQIFNNWSPAMVQDPGTIWLGLEYFCQEGDGLWSMDDGRFIDFAAAELEKLGLVDRADILDGTVIRVAKAYPAYFGEYRQIGKVRAHLDKYSNLYPVGRNGMHRYNNQDHSMLSANRAVSSIIDHGRGKADIWNVNSDEEYHEAAGAAPQRSATELM
jgi:protoporphyrinogen oxidase